MKEILPSTLTNFPKSASRLYDAVRKTIREKAEEENLKPTEVQITQRELRERTGFSHDVIKRNLRVLVEYEYIRNQRVNRGARRSYSLASDNDVLAMNISSIPDTDKLTTKLGQSGAVNEK